MKYHFEGTRTKILGFCKQINKWNLFDLFEIREKVSLPESFFLVRPRKIFVDAPEDLGEIPNKSESLCGYIPLIYTPLAYDKYKLIKINEPDHIDDFRMPDFSMCNSVYLGDPSAYLDYTWGVIRKCMLLPTIIANYEDIRHLSLWDHLSFDLALIRVQMEWMQLNGVDVELEFKKELEDGIIQYQYDIVRYFPKYKDVPDSIRDKYLG